MPTKMLNPNTTLWVVPESGVVNPEAPTAAEINAGVNISCAIIRGYTLNPIASDLDKTASICDTGNVSVRLFDNYDGSLTMFRDANSADVTSIFNIAWNLFRNPDNAVWIYRRLGKRNTVAATTGDIVEGFLFTNDHTISVDGGSTAGPIEFTVPLLPKGHYTGYVNIV